MARLPKTDVEWQEAVDLAEVWLRIHSAVLYGLVTAPKIDVARCEELLERGRKRGVVPSADCVERLVPILAGAGSDPRRG